MCLREPIGSRARSNSAVVGRSQPSPLDEAPLPPQRLHLVTSVHFLNILHSVLSDLQYWGFSFQFEYEYLVSSAIVVSISVVQFSGELGSRWMSILRFISPLFISSRLALDVKIPLNLNSKASGISRFAPATLATSNTLRTINITFLTSTNLDFGTAADCNRTVSQKLARKSEKQKSYCGLDLLFALGSWLFFLMGRERGHIFIFILSAHGARQTLWLQQQQLFG